MPNTFCSAAGCSAVVPGRERYCDEHRRQRHKRGETYDQDFYGRKQWKELRATYRRDHPLCERCRREAATQVHHKIPRRIRPDLSLSWHNLEALCGACHRAEHGHAGGKRR